MRRLAYVLLSAALVSCASTPTASRPTATVLSDSVPTSAAASVVPSVPIDASQDSITGPGGMTLRQEVGAVMMVGFSGPLTAAILDDWRQRQFGGLLLLLASQHAADVAGTRPLIDSVRGVMAHPLLAATDQTSESATAVSEHLKTLGFDINLEPDADVMPGQNPTAVAQRVTSVIAATHAAGLYAVASVSARSLQAHDWIPLRAAIGARVDMVMIRDVSVPALRSELGFQGVLVSSDLQSLAPDAAVRFLTDGGDTVIVTHDIAVADATYDAIHRAVLTGAYRRSQLDASVQKLLNLGLRFMP